MHARQWRSLKPCSALRRVHPFCRQKERDLLVWLGKLKRALGELIGYSERRVADDVFGSRRGGKEVLKPIGFIGARLNVGAISSVAGRSCRSNDAPQPARGINNVAAKMFDIKQ